MLHRRAALASLCGLCSLSATAQPTPLTDRYGGFRSMRFSSTGWFHLVRRKDRHLFVTPEGHGYLALGVNHIGAVAQGPDTRFFAAQYGSDWKRFEPALLAQLRQWNCNTLGYGAPRELERSMPYFAAITLAPIEKHRSHAVQGEAGAYAFPDVFDPRWQQQLDKTIATACTGHRENSYLIGYFWTDTPTWDLVKTRGLRNTDWVSAMRQLPASAPGRRRYTEFLTQKYASRLEDCNMIYGLRLRSLADLDSTDLTRIAIGRHIVIEDDNEFLGLIARQYYQIAGVAQRKHDPNHLVLGERYLVGDAPAQVLAAALPHIDAVSVQPGDRYTKLYPPSTRYPAKAIERLIRLTSKPVLLCDHAISFPTPEQPKTIFEQAPDAPAAARASAEFLRQASANPSVIGYLRCQYIDRPAGFGRGLRQGLLDAGGKPRDTLVAAYTEGFRQWLDRFVTAAG